MAPGALTSFNPRPVPGFPDTRSAIVRAAWTPVRDTPSHRSEMTNQLVLGEVVELLERSAERWFAIRAPDGYEGHASVGALREVDAEDAAAWTAAADGFSRGTELRTPEPADADAGPDGAPAAAGHAPWGARLPRAGGGYLHPDGHRVAALHPDRIVFGPERALAYETEPAAAAATAREWMGAPYVWGGRIREGVDCSGLVQAVYSLHGFRLPRDSRDQFAAGPRRPEDADPAEDARPGDLWFFAWEGRPVSHVGIFLGETAMIHASETRGGVSIDRLGEGEFGRHLAAGFAGSVRPVG